MTKNIKRIFFVSLLLVILLTITCVNAANQTDSTNNLSLDSQHTTVAQTQSNVNNNQKVIQTEDNNKKINDNKTKVKKNIKKDEQSYAYLDGNDKYSSLKNNYHLGALRYADYETMSDYELDEPINLTVNGETHELTNSYSIWVDTSLFDENNPIFTTYGSHNISVSFNDSYLGYIIINKEISIFNDSNIFNVMYSNGTYLCNHYTICNLRYGADYDYVDLLNFPLNLTVNGETHEVVTDSNADVNVDMNIFDENNPIFTTLGDNNITISLSSVYGEYINNTVFNVNSTPMIYTSYCNNPTYLDDYYQIIELKYGNEKYIEYLNIPINLTVNDETKTIDIWSGDVVVTKNDFNSDNPIFTTTGENNITISFDNEKYGKYNNTIIFKTVKPSVILDELNDKYENIKFVDINWKLENYQGSRIINVVINNQSIEAYNYYDYTSEYQTINFTYRFVPDNPGNYSVYIEVVGDSGDLNSSVEEFEVVSINPDKLKLNVTLDYNNTVFKGQKCFIRGKVIDENNQSYNGIFTFNYNNYFTESDGTFEIQLNSEYYTGDYNFYFVIDETEYYEKLVVPIVITFTDNVLNTTDINIIWNQINDTQYSNTIYFTGKLVDNENKPLLGVYISFRMDGGYVPYVYTDEEGNFNTFCNDNLKVGVHNISAIIETKNGSYSSNTTFNIIKSNPQINILYDNERDEFIHSILLEGDVNYYSPYSPSNIIYFKMNNQIYNTTFDSNWNIKLPINQTGEYFIEIFIPEGENNTEVTINKTVIVNSINHTKLNGTLTMEYIDDVNIGDGLSINGQALTQTASYLEHAPIKIVVTGENYSQIINTKTDYWGNYNEYVVLPQGDYHVQVSLEDIDYESIVKEQDCSVIIKNFDSLYYRPITTGYLNNSYIIGELNSYSGSSKGISLNVTVNGETHEIITDYYGYVYINNAIYSENNPIFTTPGENNITIQVNGENYKSFIEEFVLTITEPKIIYAMKNNGTYLMKHYYIGNLIYGNEEIYEYLRDMAINITVNDEKHEVTTDVNGAITIDTNIFSSNNSIFTTIGDNNITISFNNDTYGEYYNDTIFSVIDEGRTIYHMDNNESYVYDNYYIGYLTYGNENHYEYLNPILINLTINGETHEITVYGDIEFDNSIFDSENPIFTTAGDNNITISFVNDEYGEYYNSIVFTTIKPYIEYDMITNSHLKKDYYNIGYLSYGDKKHGFYGINNVPINLTVNGETRIVETCTENRDGSILVDKSIFSADNPIFTTVGDNIINISFNNSEYGEFSTHMIFTTTESHISYEMENNGTYLWSYYDIGYLTYGNNLDSEYLSIPINLTVNGETRTVTADRFYGISIFKDEFSSENPIFTTAGDNNITISFNDSTYGEYCINVIFTTTEANILYRYGENATIVKDNYYLGELSYGNEMNHRYLSIPINLTINGETQEITTNYGDMYIDSGVFSEDNPIFTTIGDNNITISFDNELYGSYENSFTLTTLPAKIFADVQSYALFSNNSYYIGSLHNGTETYSYNLDDMDVNLTINGEIHTISTYSGDIYVNSDVFSSDNPIFTTIGDNNITISFNDSTYGEFYEEFVFSTIGYVIKVNPIESATVNDTVLISGYVYDTLNNTVDWQEMIITVDNDKYYVGTDDDGYYQLNYQVLDAGVHNVTISMDVGPACETVTQEFYAKEPQSQEDYIKELEDKIKEYEDLIKQLNNTINNQSQTINELNNNNSQLQEQLDNATNKIDDLEQNVENLTNENNQLQQQLNTTQNELTKAQDTINKQNQTITDLEKQINNQTQQIKDLNDKLNKSNTNNTQLAQQLTQLNNTKNNLEKQLNDTQKQLTQAQNMITQQDKTIKDLQKQLNDTKNNNTQLQQQLTQAKENNTKLQKDLKDALDKAKTLEGQIKNQTTQINNLEKQLTDSNKVINNQNKTIQEQNNQIKTLNNTVKDLNKTINNQTKTIDDLTKQIENLTSIKDTTLTVEATNASVGKNVTFTATVKDANGQNVNNGVVSFKVNGITIKDKNGNTIFAKVINGKASIKYTAQKTWYNKNLTVMASYSGNGYKDARNTTTNFNVTAGKVNLKLLDQPVHENGEYTQFVATLQDDEGNNINEGMVIFKINGLTLKDANGKNIQVKVVNGVATLDYKIALSTKVHNITVVYNNKGYNRTEAKNTLNVTKGEAFIRAEPIKTSTNKTLITANIVNQYKENVNSQVAVAFKLNGKTAARTTAVNGVINTTLDTNFKPGTYLLEIIIGETGMYKSDRITTTIIKS